MTQRNEYLDDDKAFSVSWSTVLFTVVGNVSEFRQLSAHYKFWQY